MNEQCPRCLSSSFEKKSIDVHQVPAGYRVIGQVPTKRQITGCAFCEDATVAKVGGGFTTQVRVERQPEAVASR